MSKLAFLKSSQHSQFHNIDFENFMSGSGGGGKHNNRMNASNGFDMEQQQIVDDIEAVSVSGYISYIS